MTKKVKVQDESEKRVKELELKFFLNEDIS